MDFEVGLAKVQPSAKREGFATIPDVTWDDVGAMHNLRAEMQISIVQPILVPERCARHRTCAARCACGTCHVRDCHD